MPRQPRNKNAANNIDKIVEMYNEGATAEEIGKKFGASKSTILRTLRHQNVHMRSDRKIYLNNPEIIRLYNDGVPLEEIAAKFNCTRPTICRILKEENVQSRDRDYSMEREEVVKMYTEEGVGINTVGKKFNVSPRFVLKHARKAGVMRTNEDYQYNLNIDYFKQIDTRNKAYVLGIMYADGNVTDNHDIRLSLTEKDKNILDKIKEDMGYDGPLQYCDNAKRKYKTKPCYTLSIKRVKMAKDLIKLGCMPNKTWEARFPGEGILPPEFIADFCRGYWDGDGHVSKDEKTLAVIGNKFFISEMITKLPINNPRLYYKQSTKFTDDPDKQTLLCYVGIKHGVKQLIQFLYGDCDKHLYLPRKRDKALHWLSKL